MISFNLELFCVADPFNLFDTTSRQFDPRSFVGTPRLECSAARGDQPARDPDAGT
jgi:hypothetical protein